MAEAAATKKGVYLTERKPPLEVWDCHEPPVVILFHGWLGTHEDLVQIADELTSKGYRTLIPDLPYHGQSCSVKPVSLADCARLIIEAISKSLGLYRPKPIQLSLLGYSLGGRLAVQVAVLINQEYSFAFQVSSLVLISCAPPPLARKECDEKAQHGQRIAGMLQGVVSTEEGIDGWLRSSWYSAPMWGNLDRVKGFESMIASRSRGFNEEKKASWMDAAVHLAVYGSHAQEVVLPVPVLYMHGEYDGKYTQLADRWKTICRDFRSVSFKRAGHNILLQCPELTASTVIKFLGKDCSLRCSGKEILFKSVKVQRYSLPLTHPFVVAGRTVSVRKGFLILLVSSAGNLGIGDICPLPGLHSEDLDSCMSEFQCFVDKMKLYGHRVCTECSVTHQVGLLTKGLAPVVANGISCAIVHVVSQTCGTKLSSYLRHLHASRLAVLPSSAPVFQKWLQMNGVLPRIKSNPGEDLETVVRNKVEEYNSRCSFRVLKLKVGSAEDITWEATNVGKTVRALKSKGRRIRLDANRSWSTDKFLQFQRTLGSEIKNVDFIEEPLRNTQELHDYVHRSEEGLMPIALDESLSDSSFQEVQELASTSLCTAFVIKPCVIGCLSHVLELARLGEENKCSIVFSSTFDSGIGLAWTSLLASALAPPGEYHGVATYDYLHKDIHVPSFQEMCIEKGSPGATGWEGYLISIESCEKFLSYTATWVFRTGSDL